MIKITFNNDDEHILNAISMNYQTTFSIDNYSTRTDSLSIYLSLDSLGNLAAFENTAIESMKLISEDGDEIVDIPFSISLYLLNSNTQVFENGSTNIRANFGGLVNGNI